MAEEEFWARPVFKVRDVASSVAYYRDVLGFGVRWQRGEIAEMERGGATLMLDATSDLPRAAGPSVLALELFRPLELVELHRAFSARGARIAAAPFAVVWQVGTSQMDVLDLDDNVLMFWGATQ